MFEKPAKRGPKPPKRIKRGGPIKRTSRPRKKRKSVRARLIEKADALCRALVLKREACEACQSVEYPQWAHGYSRRYLRTRWSTWFTFRLCRGCHYLYTKHWELWVQWMRLKLGPELYDKMHMDALNKTPITNDEIEIIITDLERQLSVENVNEEKA